MNGSSLDPKDIYEDGFELSVFSRVPLEDSTTNIEKAYEKGVNAILQKYVEIDRGAVKIVWVKRSKIRASGQQNISTSAQKMQSESVYYTAISSWWGRKTAELKSEFEKMQTIGKKIELKSGSSENLAVQGKERKGEKQIGEGYTLKVERASTNFENKLRQPETALNERIRFGSHLLRALSNLHLADYAHGDMKPENCLIFEKDREFILKISDFGKTELVGNGSYYYRGNMRYAPPEGLQSKKGDVYGAALMLIRNFEEEYLQANSISSLIQIEEKERDMPAQAGVRGIEHYIIESKAFLAFNDEFSLYNYRRRIAMTMRSKVQQENQSSAIHMYIDALHEELSKDDRFSDEQVEAFCYLLKNMTDADPKARISAEEASEHYDQIFYKEPGGTTQSEY